MRCDRLRLVAALAVFVLIPAALPAPAARRSLAAAGETIACRVLEAHTSAQQQTTVVVFHHQDQKDSARLGTLLRQHSEASVEFQTADGTWHSATVLRLKSCFGRGLLLFPSGAAQLAEKDVFLLKFR